ncbi:MAG TPA: hypothetical protein VHX92_04810 [Rhizomicrobium sp.]|jgi:hypothetical protein|nr:hypothetical protein [Rhizomicrobium sp.]
MGQLASLLDGAVSNIWGTLAAAGIAALLAGSATAYVVHRMDEGAIAAIKLADQKAQTQAIQDADAIRQSQDQANLDAALAEAKAQQAIVSHTHTVTREVTIHVPQTQSCIPYGLVRVLDDAATGSDTADAATAAGQSDDACTGISWRAFAGDLTGDYGIGRANAEQLNALEANVTALVAAANVKPGNDGDTK